MDKHTTTSTYTCPMHPEVVSDQPGMCPECGMNLVPSKKQEYSAHQSHKHQTPDKHTGHSTKKFLQKFWVSLILTLPVLFYADIFRQVFGWQPPNFPLSQFLPLVFGTIVFFYGGWVFLVGAWREIKGRLPGMMTLIALAITAAYLYSLYATFISPEHTLYWELTTLITIMLLGHWLEMRAVSGVQGALKELSKLLPDTAEVIRNNETKSITLAELQEKDVVIVRPGGRIPADGKVTEGQSEVNEAAITGESAPVTKKVNSLVIAGTINGDGSLKIEVTKVGEKTFLAGVMRLVKEAQASKSKLQILSDRAAFYLTILAVVTGTITFIVWLMLNAGFQFATERLVAVLVITCPHALGLAVPLVASISTTLAARSGFLVKQRIALEAARDIDIVLFDKTGTLTKGEYGVTNIWTVTAQDEQSLLQLAASVDNKSEHFISKAIVGRAKEQNLSLLEVTNFKRLTGQGVKGTIDQYNIYVGGQSLFNDLHVTIPEKVQQDVNEENHKGKTIIYVIREAAASSNSKNELLGVIALADLIRDESREAIASLKAIAVKVAMITGDSPAVAAWVANELSIDEYFAHVMPDEKSAKVKTLQARNLKVAMVGDGINDAPALTQADVGIAIGAGTNVAIESAGIILVRNDPRDIAKIIRLSKLTYTKMIQNLFWATGYNIFALPLAAGILAFKGIFLQPALAALLMSLSTIIVAVNAVLLRRNNL